MIKGICTEWIIKNNLPKVVKEGLKNLIKNIAESVQSNIWNIRNEQVIHFNNSYHKFINIDKQKSKKIKKKSLIDKNMKKISELDRLKNKNYNNKK